MLTLLALVSCGLADDWPQWRGPQRNGISQETGLLKEWPKEGPKLLWQVDKLGSGYSTPAVAGDRLYLLGNEGLENEFVQGAWLPSQASLDVLAAFGDTAGLQKRTLDAAAGRGPVVEIRGDRTDAIPSCLHLSCLGMDDRL